MSVNYDIWGAQESWIDGSASQQLAEIKLPATDKDTYRENWQRGAMEWNIIDLSPCFYGVNKEAVWCNPHYLAPYAIGGDKSTIDVYEEAILEEKKTQPLVLGRITSAGSTLSVSYTRRWKEYEMADIGSGTPIGNSYGESVVMSFNYQKIMAIPYVVVIPNSYTTGAYTTIDLYSYIEDQNYLTNQRIIGIGYRLRYGDGETNRTTAENYLAPLFNFDIPGKNVAYNSKAFFAHVDGMSMLMWSDRTHNAVMGIETSRVSGDATVGTADTGFRFKYCPGNDGSSVPLYFYNSDDEFENGGKVWTINKETYAGSGTTVYWQPYPYIGVNATNAEEVKKYVMKQVAFLGFPFVYDPDDAAQGKIGDIGVYLPVFDENGITTGDYKEGTDALRLPNSEWVDSREGSGYDPTKVDPSPSSDPMLPVGLNFTLASNGTGIWALTPSNLNEVLDDIFGSKIKADMFGNNPMNAILSLKWTPFIWQETGTQERKPIVLGDQVVNPLHRYPTIETYSQAEVHGVGTVKFTFDKNFYNSRYMQARLFLPFYGYYELPIAQLLSSELRIDFYYNVPDELGVYVISYDNIIYDYCECSCDIEVPLTGSNAAAISASKKNEALAIATQVASTALSTIAFIGTGGLSGVAEFASMSADAGSLVGGIQSLPYLYNAAPREAIRQVAGLTTASTLVGGTGAGILNTISNSKVQRAALKTNLPYHGSALQTTFLHLSMKPYIQIFKNNIIQGLDTENIGTVKVKLGGTSEEQYKLKVGHVCDIFTTIDKMPENSLLQTTGIANMSNMGMELGEIQELNQILQTGFYR